MVEPKFKIGDEVYVMRKNCVVQIKITGMIKRLGGGYKFTEGLYSTFMGENDGYDWYSQEKVFKSKKLLVEAL